MRGKRLMALLGSICLILILASLSFAACAEPAPAPTPAPAPAPAPAPKNLKIGYAGSLTGFLADVLKLEPRGAEVVRDIINEKGGITIKGEQYLIDLIIEDCKGSPDGAKSAATKLVYDDKVKFVAGPMPLFMSTPIDSVTEPNKVLYSRSHNSGTEAEHGPQSLYQFQIVGTLETAEGSFVYCKELWPEVKTIAALWVDDGSVPDINKRIRPMAESHGITILGDVIGWSPDTVDWSAYVQKAMALNPDAIMWGNGSVEASAQILKNARQAGFTKPMFGCAGGTMTEIAKVAGESATKCFGVDTISPEMLEKYPLLRELYDRIIDKYGIYGGAEAVGFDALYCMVQAIEAAQSLDPTVVRDTWEKMDTIDTLTGTGKMGGMETYGIRHSVYGSQSYNRAENGKVSFGTEVFIYHP